MDQHFDRRTFIVAGMAATAGACNSLGGSMEAMEEVSDTSAEVAIALRIYIPSPIVSYAPLDVQPLRQAFNGGDKATLSATIDLAAAGAASLRRTGRAFARTYEYNTADALPVAGKPDWWATLSSGAASIRNGKADETDAALNAAWATPGGASHGALLKVVGKNPLVALAPPIDAELTIGLRRNAGVIEYRLEGKHDGFPNYQLQLNGTTVYSFDAVSAGNNPRALFDPLDITVSKGWTRL